MVNALKCACLLAGGLLLVSVALLAGAAYAQPNPPDLWGELEAGQYRVGFKSVLTYDQTRPAIPYSDWQGALTPTRETTGRQMQISIWYPATVGESRRLDFGDYVDLLAMQTDFDPMSQPKRRFASGRFIAHTNDLGGEGFTEDHLNTLRKLSTRAHLNAAPVAGNFPLIVFPNGGSPAFQSVMCEYFASHGFIVAAMALKGEHAFTGGASLRGLETAVQDLDFAVGQVFQQPNIDKRRLGLIGNANASSHIVAYQTRNSNVDAVVSLEGGLLSRFEQDILRQTAFYQPQSVTVPILAIFAPHPSIDPVHIDKLRYADRYYLNFPGMSEFHFLNYGALERFVPGIIGAPSGDVLSGHAVAARYALAFLKAYLGDDAAGKALIAGAPPPWAAGVVDRQYVKPGLKPPPTITAVKDRIGTQGFAAFEAMFENLRQNDEVPFDEHFYRDLSDWLAWKRDPDYSQRVRLYQLGIQSLPNAAELYYQLGYVAEQAGMAELAQSSNRRALHLIDTAPSPELTVVRRERMREVLGKALTEESGVNDETP